MNLLKWNAMALVVLAACGRAYADGPVKFTPVRSIYTDGKNVGLAQPEGVGCGIGSVLVVADPGNGRVLQYGLDNDSNVPVKEIKLPQVPFPIRAQMNLKGEILALDGKSRRIARISPAGEFAGFVDIAGAAPGAVVARSFAIDDKDNIHILDIYSGRVLSAGPSGNFLGEVPFPARHGFISDVMVDSSGTVYLVDSVEGKLYSARKDSKEFSLLSKSLKEYCDFPVGLAADRKGHIFVVDKNGSRIVILGRDGSFQGQQLGMGWKEGLLRYPSQICVSGGGELIIADSGNNRVQIFSVSE